MNLNYFKNINVKNKIIVNLVTFFLISSIIICLIIIPTINNIKELRVNIVTQKIDLEKKIAKEKNMNILSEKLNTIEPQLEKFEKIFISQNRELEFITTLEEIANNNYVRQKINLDPLLGQSEQIYKKIPLNLNIQGKFYNLVKYLTDLEALNYYINIKSLEITTAPSAGSALLPAKYDNIKEEQSGNINLVILADTYWK